jgi:hypothetical protein
MVAASCDVRETLMCSAVSVDLRVYALVRAPVRVREHGCSCFRVHDLVLETDQEG